MKIEKKKNAERAYSTGSTNGMFMFSATTHGMGDGATRQEKLGI